MLTPLEPIDLSRRSLLKTGLAGTVLLATGSLMAQLQGCTTSAVSPATGNGALRLFRAQDEKILRACVPVILAGAFPPQRQAALDTFLPRLDEFLYNTNTANHTALHQLFDALDMRLTRFAVAGLWGDWNTQSDADIEHFLARWRDSSINQFRLGYAQLTQAVNLVWYAWPGALDNERYPGPPEHIPTPPGGARA